MINNDLIKNFGRNAEHQFGLPLTRSPYYSEEM